MNVNGEYLDFELCSTLKGASALMTIYEFSFSLSSINRRCRFEEGGEECDELYSS